MPSLSVTPAELNFGGVPVDTSEEATIIVENVGGGELEVFSASLDVDDRDAWDLSRTDDSVLAGGDRLVLTVAFAPQEVEVENGRIQLRSSVEDLLTIPLTGEGTPSVADEDGDGFSAAEGDCNDDRDDVYPGAPELCDGRDNDCTNGVPADETDGDNDGWRLCDADCDDDDGDVYPGAAEICDGKDSDCSGDGNQDDADVDGDSASICEGDCDDGEALAYPGNLEVCGDGVDNDCSGDPDDVDVDGDGHSPCHPAGDCDDSDGLAYPVVVDAAAGGGGDGTDADPYDDLAVAIANVDGVCNTLWLAEGTYAVSASLDGEARTLIGQGASVVIEPDGGRIFDLSNGASLTLQDLTLTGADVVGDGGAIAAADSMVTLLRVRLEGNSCGGDGGAIAASAGSTVSLDSCVIVDNTSADDGGAVYLAASDLSDLGSTYGGNSGNRGGALFVSGGSVDLNTVRLDGNTADVSGGAVFVQGPTVDLVIERSEVWRNTAAQSGGGIAIEGLVDPQGAIRNNVFQNNTSGADGGAMSLTGTLDTVVSNNTFYVNNATGDGAHLFVDGTASTLIVVANAASAGNAGTGFYVEPGSLVAATFNTVFLTAGVDFAGELTAGVDDNLADNPVFAIPNDDADPTNDDLSPGGGSPLIDSGPTGTEWDDPDGSQNDRGHTGGPGAFP